MKTESFWWLAAVVAAHKDRQVVGRTRLQKTVKLLQRLGMPTDYVYKIFFYGPYSEGVYSDTRLLEQLGLVREEEHTNQDGEPYFLIKATEQAVLPEFQRFQGAVQVMEQANPVVLELAATYDAFREMEDSHESALIRLRQKKGKKCEGGNEQAALSLLERLGLPSVPEDPS